MVSSMRFPMLIDSPTTGGDRRHSSTTIWIELDLVGFHRWPDAPPARDYLVNRHRHTFRVRVDVLVAHDERDIEFHDLTDAVRTWWGPAEREWDGASCEAIARELGEHLIGNGVVVESTSVAVFGEGGAIARWEEAA